MARISNYAVGAGYGLSLGSLAYWEEITATGDTQPFVAPMGIGFFRLGMVEVRGDGTNFYRGYSTQDLLFAAMTRNQYRYIRNTFCGGGYSGKVTIYTAPGDATYARYNAVLWLDQLADSDFSFFAGKAIKVHFRRMVAL